MMMPQAMVSKIAIDCILSKGSEGLQGEGCIYALSSSPPSITGPETLHPGDYVKLRLWLPDDESTAIYIDLAEVQWVKHHWVKLDLLLTHPLAVPADVMRGARLRVGKPAFESVNPTTYTRRAASSAK